MIEYQEKRVKVIRLAYFFEKTIINLFNQNLTAAIIFVIFIILLTLQVAAIISLTCSKVRASRLFLPIELSWL